MNIGMVISKNEKLTSLHHILKACILLCTFPEGKPEPERRAIDNPFIYDSVTYLSHK